MGTAKTEETREFPGKGGGLFRKLKISGGTVNLTGNPLKKKKISSTEKGDTNSEKVSKEQTIQQNKNKNKKFWQSPFRV